MLTDFTTEDLTRFWSRVNKNGTIPAHRPELGSCWERPASNGDRGYGRFRLGTRLLKAHRVSWMIHYGQILEDLGVLHRCDNRCCVRPDHLFVGTTLENNRDCISKGRGNRAKGEHNAHAKLTVELVREIFILVSEKRETMYSIAKRLKMDKTSIRQVITGKTWGHATADLREKYARAA